MTEEHLDQFFQAWAKLHRKEMGQDLQYEGKYDLARAAFEAGYALAKDTLVVPKQAYELD